MPFQKYRDEESGAVFLYNAQTGETKWESAIVTGPPPTDLGDDIELQTLDLSALPNINMQTVAGNDDSVVLSESASDDEDALLSPKPCGLANPSTPPPNNPTSHPLSPPPSTTYDTTADAVLFCGPCCVRVNAFCCEGPAAVIEGYLKALFYLLASLFLFLIGVASLNLPYFLPTARAYFREGCLFTAASFTLMMPCAAACFVYRDFSATQDWAVTPIPTLLGWVDSRRFGTFESGDGAMAANGYVFEAESMDSWKQGAGYSPILHPPQYTQDRICARIFGVRAPEREHLEVVVEMENRRAQRAIKREKKLQSEGWLNVR